MVVTTADEEETGSVRGEGEGGAERDGKSSFIDFMFKIFRVPSDFTTGPSAGGPSDALFDCLPEFCKSGTVVIGTDGSFSRYVDGEEDTFYDAQEGNLEIIPEVVLVEPPCVVAEKDTEISVFFSDRLRDGVLLEGQGLEGVWLHRQADEAEAVGGVLRIDVPAQRESVSNVFVIPSASDQPGSGQVVPLCVLPERVADALNRLFVEMKQLAISTQCVPTTDDQEVAKWVWIHNFSGIINDLQGFMDGLEVDDLPEGCLRPVLLHLVQFFQDSGAQAIAKYVLRKGAGKCCLSNEELAGILQELEGGREDDLNKGCADEECASRKSEQLENVVIEGGAECRSPCSAQSTEQTGQDSEGSSELGGDRLTTTLSRNDRKLGDKILQRTSAKKGASAEKAAEKLLGVEEDSRRLTSQDTAGRSSRFADIVSQVMRIRRLTHSDSAFEEDPPHHIVPDAAVSSQTDPEGGDSGPTPVSGSGPPASHDRAAWLRRSSRLNRGMMVSVSEERPEEDDSSVVTGTQRPWVKTDSAISGGTLRSMTSQDLDGVEDLDNWQLHVKKD